jgi:hypothetical protein
MTNHHTARPGEWADQENWACHDADSPCIIELRARIEALEAAQQPPQDKLDRLIALDQDDPSGSLVERVANALYDVPLDSKVEARAAILEVAAWMREQRDLIASTALTREANR